MDIRRTTEAVHSTKPFLHLIIIYHSWDLHAALADKPQSKQRLYVHQLFQEMSPPINARKVPCISHPDSIVYGVFEQVGNKLLVHRCPLVDSGVP